MITHAGTTVHALREAVELLAPGGLLTVVVYTGHDGAREEADAVAKWVATLATERYRVVEDGRLEARERSPYLVAIERLDAP